MQLPTVLITGASRGIGRAIAHAFAKGGYELFLTCRTCFSLLEGLKIELERTYHIHCHIFQCDMGKADDVEGLFKIISPPDILVNNAGISYEGLLSEMSISDWDELMATNLNSVFYTCRQAIPHMVHRKKGRIINISSIWGNVGASMETAYSASKGGMNSLTRALARELAPSNIQVNAIACGMIDTQMNQGYSQEEIAAILEEIPMGRQGRPEEVAELALFLAHAPEYLTGQIITIDGGWT
ncbi:MAG: SDR family oxidoreductase [Lachnospiraceae bacterium]|nr:SDR family oxidoreductase [Lachnospiraceae bacterium]